MKGVVRNVLEADFVYGPLTLASRVQLVGKIQQPRRLVAHVPIRMDHKRRNGDAQRPFTSSRHQHAVAGRRRIDTVIPETKLELT